MPAQPRHASSARFAATYTPPWRAEQRRRRGEQQEQFDRIVPGQPIEGNRTAELWLEDIGDIGAIDIGAGKLASQCIADRRCRMNDATQRRLGQANFLEHRRQRGRVGDIAGMDRDLGAESAEFGRAVGRSRRPRRAVPIARSSRHRAGQASGPAKPNPEMPVTR